MNRQTFRAGFTIAWCFAIMGGLVCCRERAPDAPKPKLPCWDGKSGPLDCKRDDSLEPARPIKVTSALERACEGIARAGCPEAHPAKVDCPALLASYEADHVEVDSACLARAQTPQDVRACGGPGLATIRCQTPATGH